MSAEVAYDVVKLEIGKLSPQPGELIVLRISYATPPDAIRMMAAEIGAVLPDGVRCLFLVGDQEICVVNDAKATQAFTMQVAAQLAHAMRATHTVMEGSGAA